ncbi:GntR family transcriptional regulator [Thalassorhabdomicrobium marinisediminis]|nr:GntR family transcriptional regulator [Thalassorhabdomicrobium marinisediminis]
MTTPETLDIPLSPMAQGATEQEAVYARLRHGIMIGTIAPGTTLTMRGLAETLGVSPTPVREAVRRLGSENAIQMLPNRRMTIPMMTLGRFEELVALRVALEVHAAERALPYVSDIMIDQLEALDLQMDRAMGEERHDDLTLLNQDFHRQLYSANPHQVSIPAIESVWLQLGPFQRQVVKNVKEFYVIDRHKEIVAALRSRDVAALVGAIDSDIREGISRSGRRVLEQMREATNLF